MKTGIMPQGKDLDDMEPHELLEFLETKDRNGLINLILAILGRPSLPDQPDV